MKPRHLTRGDRIAVLAPASSYTKNDYAQIQSTVRRLGLEAEIMPTCYSSHGYFAGTDEERLKDLHDAFENPVYKGIICLKGGYGTPRLLEALDMALIKQHFKPFLGYSDITALHTVFNNEDLVTFHAPMATSQFNDNYTLSAFKAALFNTAPLRIRNPNDKPLKVLYPGRCTGQIVGGNLSLIVATLGSPYELNTKGKILFIEEVNEPIYKIDRMLTSLHLAGKFADCVGVLLGTFTGCHAPSGKKSLTLNQVYDELITPYQKPIFKDLSAGHIQSQLTLPFNVTVTLDTQKQYLQFIEAATF